ncbi:MAG: leucine-rich repeat domain-containing protein [Bacteroides sp.]|nr:leucine-rich repeat domain-containing protein [Bacteroides sp.]
MKQRIFIFLLLLITAWTASARDFEYEGIVYTVLDEEARTVETKRGQGAQPGNIVTGELVLPSNPKQGETEYTLVNIGARSFYETNLTSIIIPESVNSIGDKAFYGCSGLSSITLPESISYIHQGAFENCTGMHEITYNATDCTFDSYVWSGVELTKLIIGENVKKIGGEFQMSKLDSLEFNATHLTHPTLNYDGLFPASTRQIYFGSNVTVIPEKAFMNCTNLNSVELPKSLVSIEMNAFTGCTSLTSIQFPEALTSIGNFAFDSCTSLTSIYLPESLTSIGTSAFNGCTGIKTITYNARDCKFEYNAWKGVKATKLVLGENVKRINGCASDHGSNSSPFIQLSELEIVEYNIVDYPKPYFNEYAEMFPSSVTQVSFGPKVTIIPKEAFSHCNKLTSISLPNLLTSIGEEAFFRCTALTTIELPESLTSIGSRAFAGCIALTSIQFPQALTYISSEAFSSCTALTSIQLPKFLTSLDKGVFQECTGLISIQFSESVISIGSTAFSNCSSLTSIQIPISVTSIGDGAFSGCTSLTSFQFSESLTSIGSSVLYDCTDLKEITYNARNCKLNEYALAGVNATKLIIGENVESIEMTGYERNPISAFLMLSKLEEVEYNNVSTLRYEGWDEGNLFPPTVLHASFSNKITSIPDKLFSGCTGLLTIQFPTSLSSIGYETFRDCVSLTNLQLPESLTSIGQQSFQGCTGLTSLQLPKSLTSIGYSAFSGCTGLTSLQFPESLTSIGQEAFKGCIGLSSLQLPEALTSIGDYAFIDCTNLKEITYNAKDCKFGYDVWKESRATKIVLGENVKAINKCYFSTDGSSNNESGSPFLQLSQLETVEYNVIGRLTSQYGRDVRELFPPSVKQIYFGPKVTIIPNYAFYGCSNLTSIKFPESLTSIGIYAFRDCTKLSSIQFPKSLTDIGERAFQDCTSIITIQFPESLSSIGYCSFYGCTGLTSIQFPASLNTIEAGAFYGCSALSSVELPNSLSTIYYEVFSGTNLKSIIIPESVTQIYFNAFAGIPTLEEVIFNANKCEYVKANSESDSNLVGAWGDTVKTFVVGENVESMDKVFISKLTNLETLELNSTRFIKNFNDLSVRNPLFSSTLSSVKLGNKITEIPAYTFTQCKNITSITFPESLSTIGTYAFNGCSGLTSLTIDKNISSIGYNAFSSCLGIENLYYNAPTINSSVFSSCNIRNIMIGENVSTIESGAFTNAGNVESVEFNAIDCSNTSAFSYSIFPACVSTVTFGEKVTKIPNNFLNGCNIISSIDLPTTVENIGDYAFRNCTGLSQFIIPEKVDSIGKYSFEGCSGLTGISIPKNISALAEGTFADCTGLTDISFSQNLTSIGDKAFFGCTGLTDLSLPVGLEYVGEKAFSGCDGITTLVYNIENCKWKNNNGLPTSIINLTVGEKVKNVQTDKIFSNLTSLKTVDYRAVNAEEAENGYYYYNRCFPASVNTVNIGGNVETIPSQLFSGIEGLTTVSFESRSIPLYIGSGAFYYSSSISTVNVPTLADWLKLNFKSIESNPVNYSKKLLIGNENVRRITIPAGTASLGDYAFYNCEQLMTVTVPESLNQAGLEVFSNCTNLQQITFPSFSTYLGMSYENPQWDLTYKNNATIYIGSQELSEFMNQPDIVIPEGLTKIPPYAFYRSETLQSIDIPSTVVSIGEYAFGDCTNLNALNIPDSVEDLGENTFAGSGISNIKLPINMTEIPAGTFSNCSNLKSIILPASVNKIGERAFAGSAITNLTIPNGVTTLPSSLFSNCKGLEDVNIPNSVTDLGLGVFQNSGIQSISLPGHITEIPARSFYGCTNLSELKLPESVTNIGAYAFQGSGIKLINLPYELKSIGSDAFMGVTLDNLDIPDFKKWCEISFENIYANPISAAGKFTVYGDDARSITINGIYTNIRPYAFYNAKNLTRVRIYAPEIERQAFSNCSNVTALCIETDAVGPMAFSNMDSLKEIYCLTSTPPDATDDVFSNYNGVTLYVPQGSLSAYENSENCWWRFLNIVESDFAGIDQMFLSDVNTVITSVNEISSDGDESVEVFNLNGIKVADSKENLAPGLYIIVEKNRRYKIQIK